MSDARPRLKVKKSLALEQFIKFVIEACIKDIEEMPGYKEKRTDGRLVGSVMNLIETLISESKYHSKSIDKEELLIQIWKGVFEINESEEEIIRNRMLTALEDGSVKRKSTFYKILKKVLSILKLLLGL